MKQNITKMVLLVAMLVMTIVAGYAQEPSKVEAKVKEIVKQYENVKGVECFEFAKGSGLGIVKMAFNQQFGKDFMKGVKSITIINYSDASNEICQALHQELDAFSSLLEEIKPKEDKGSSNKGYSRSFAAISNGNTMSDFVIAIEDDESKMMMYMAGDIVVE
jgi:tripartite-type tricarboxylate transporter receptor subunit TctC